MLDVYMVLCSLLGAVTAVLGEWELATACYSGAFLLSLLGRSKTSTEGTNE